MKNDLKYLLSHGKLSLIVKLELPKFNYLKKDASSKSGYVLCLRLVCPVLHIPPGATVASRPIGCPVSD